MQTKNFEKLKTIVRTVLELSEGCDVETEIMQQVTARRWDSLAQVSMIAAIENEFSIILSVTDYTRMTSFKTMVSLLEEKGL